MIRAQFAVGVAAALMAVLSVAACGDRSTSPAAGAFTPRRPGVLTVVTSEIPSPGFWEGTPAHVTGGFEYELAKLLARRFGLRSVRVEIQRFHRVIRGQLGRADLALDLVTPTPRRARLLSFSSPYLNAAPTVVVRTGTSVSDLATAQDFRWGAVRGTPFVEMIANLVGPDHPPRLYDNTPDLVAGLESRQIDALLLDMPLAVETARGSGGRLQAAAQLPSTEAIAAALPKGSGNTEAVDSAFRAFSADGTIDHLLSVSVGSAAANAEGIPLLHTTR